MKKIFLLMIISISSFCYAQTSSSKTTLSNKSQKTLYQEHKKQLMEQERIFEKEKIKNSTSTDNKKDTTETEVVDFANGKPVKIK